MIADLLVLVAALVLLAFAADRFVSSASATARLLGASPLFIGVVLVGAGTSLPDWLVSGLAAANGDDGIAVGNMVGSNTINIGLALGMAAIVAPIAVSDRVLRREALYATGAVCLAALAMIGGISRIEALLLLLALPVVLWLIRPDPDRLEEEDEAAPAATGSLMQELTISFVSLFAIVVAARLLISSAEDIALEVGVSEAFIGLSLVAAGTSLPEIVVGIQAARRGATDLIVGNVLGSNLINSFGLAGTAGLVVPDAPLATDGLMAAAGLMVAFTVLAGVLVATGRTLVRWEGVLLVGVYCVTLPLFA